MRVSNFDAAKRQSQAIATPFELPLTSVEHQRPQVDEISTSLQSEFLATDKLFYLDIVSVAMVHHAGSV